MQFSSKNQKRLAIDDELAHPPMLFEVWQSRVGVTRLADSPPAKGYRD